MDSKSDVKEIKDAPLTLTAIQQFRHLLDVMEEFVRATEQEKRENQD